MAVSNVAAVPRPRTRVDSVILCSRHGRNTKLCVPSILRQHARAV